MNQPFFSVVIPTYNRCDYLAATLDSIRSQTFRAFEVIVVDNESDDGTAEMIRERPEEIHYVRERNPGPGPARNIGIREAKGEYIAFLDSDDLWFPWTLETYAQVIKQTDSPAFLSGRPRIFSKATALDREVPEGAPQWNAFQDYLASGDQWRWHGVSSFVIRRDALLQIGCFEKQPMNAEDADLALRLGTTPGFIEITRPVLFGYRTHENNLTMNAGENLKGIHSMIAKETAGDFPGGAARQRERLTIITRHIRPLSISCLKKGQTREARGLYARTWRWNLRLLRFGYLFGFPFLWLRECFRGK